MRDGILRIIKTSETGIILMIVLRVGYVFPETANSEKSFSSLPYLFFTSFEINILLLILGWRLEIILRRLNTIGEFRIMSDKQTLAQNQSPI